MISISDGTSPARIAPDTAAPASSVSAKAATIVQGAAGLGRSARVASVMMPRVPSEPTMQLGQVVPGDSLDGAPAGPQHLAGGQHHLEAEHRVGGHAVLHAAQPAGVGRQVAAERAPVVGRRIGRVEQPAGLDLGAEGPG